LDLNSIKKAFAELKAWCRKHHTEVERMTFEKFLKHAMESLKNEAKGHFVKSRVEVPLQEGSEDDY
jgi:hypothetical protein